MGRIPPGISLEEYSRQKRIVVEDKSKLFKKKLKNKKYFQKKNLSKSGNGGKKVSRDIRSFYRRAFYELSTKITNLKKMNHKELVIYLNENGISFDLSDLELREISKKEGLINYTMAYLPDLKIIKVNKNETFNNVNELVMLKKNLLDKESPSIYSDRTFTTVTPSMLDDSSIGKYETERIKNVRIKCWKVYVKATGIDVRKKEFLIYCEKNGIEVPIKPYDKTIFGFMIKKFDKKENYFLIDRSNQKSEKLRLMKKETITLNKESLPNFVEAKNILWDIDGIIGYRKNGNKIEGLCAWSEVCGRKFKPTWEPLENIQPGNEQNWQTKISNNKNVHFEDVKRKNVAIDLF